MAELPEALVPAFEALRAWRAEQAREQGVPAYVIFHDATLREIVTVWPTSVTQLGSIGGVGEKKLVTYGEGVIEVLALGWTGTGGCGRQELPAPGAGRIGGSRTPDHWPEMDAEPGPSGDERGAGY